jgi:uncharacterized 2Fe-2S/4Fe-4S cluster protein (DUF4445 family)
MLIDSPDQHAFEAAISFGLPARGLLNQTFLVMAIMAVIRVLMREMEVHAEEIEQVLLTGAFGNYIGTASALGIGLFPSVPVERIRAIGNAAGKRAQMDLLSVGERKRALVLAQRARHIELSFDKGFQEAFISSLSFDCNSQGRANL